MGQRSIRKPQAAIRNPPSMRVIVQPRDGIELLPHEDDVAGFVGSCLFTGRGDEFIETARAKAREAAAAVQVEC